MEQLSKNLMSWASILDGVTRDQAHTTSKMPFIFPHMALMPDAHLGKGATVGSVIPTVGAIMPAAVGVDIGCGMDAVRTSLTVDDIKDELRLKDLRELIEYAIPVSMGKYNAGLTDTASDHVNELIRKSYEYNFVPSDYTKDWQYQLGTLGGGNHFIEISSDDTGHIWAFLHSGSRGIGNKIATYHTKVALEQCRKRFIDLPDKDLAYLVEGEPEFWDYIKQMIWAQEFASRNRQEMMTRVLNSLEIWWGTRLDYTVKVSCHHNYTQQEKHWGKKVWLSRKGAIDASEGVLGLIPGSMGTASYVVEGLGNRLSLNSAPHGAGRLYSRSKAKEQFTIGQLRDRMKGIEYRQDANFLDEIPDAYKDINQVMEDASDLVKIKYQLTQLINVKGE